VRLLWELNEAKVHLFTRLAAVITDRLQLRFSAHNKFTEGSKGLKGKETNLTEEF